MTLQTIGTGLLRQKIPKFQSVIAASTGAAADIKISEYHVVFFGNRYVYSLHTPGKCVLKTSVIFMILSIILKTNCRSYSWVFHLCVG